MTAPDKGTTSAPESKDLPSGHRRPEDLTGLSITALVCTLNEEASLPHVLPRIPAWVDEVLIIDGHSQDATVAVAQRLCPQARILQQPGKGKGNAIKFGMREARGEIVVTLDADGETDPALLPLFVRTLKERRADIAKGTRLSHKKPKRMPAYRWFGNKVLAITYNLLYGTRFSDVCSGYSAFRKESFLKLDLPSDAFQMEQLMLCRARKAKMRIVEVPHDNEGRIAGTSKTNGPKQGFIDWFVIIGERLRA